MAEINYLPLSGEWKELLEPLFEKYNQSPIVQEIWINHFESSVLYGFYFDRYNQVFKLDKPEKIFDTEGFDDDASSQVMMKVTKIASFDMLDKMIARLDNELRPVVYENLKSVYECFSSAESHRRMGRFFADTETIGVSQSVIRKEELEELLDLKLPSAHMENYAADYGDKILYFHMDDSSYNYQNVQFNHYTYNNAHRNAMSFFDMKNGGSEINYEKWEERLSSKPVFVFGYAPKFDEDAPSPFIFLGVHRGPVGKTEDGSFGLYLSNSEAI